MYTKKYTTDSVSKIIKNTNYSNSNINKFNTTVTVIEVINNLSDVIPVDDYMPFYISKYHMLGYKRFVELANKARKGDDPKRLFFWFLKNNEIVV